MKKMLQMCICFGFAAFILTGCEKIGTQVSWKDQITEEIQEDIQESDETQNPGIGQRQMLETDETCHQDETQSDFKEVIPEKSTEEKVYVDICGAVRHPGVYIVSSGTRIYEVVEMAGGVTEDADLTRINQALPVEDGLKIRIYRIDESTEKNSGDDSSGVQFLQSEMEQETGDRKELSENTKVDLNTAGLEELMTLPGIGESRAQDILRYRETHGGFQSVEEIMKISGIKTAVFDKIKDKIVVG